MIELYGSVPRGPEQPVCRNWRHFQRKYRGLPGLLQIGIAHGLVNESVMAIYRQLNPPVPTKGIYFVGVLLNRKP